MVKEHSFYLSIYNPIGQSSKKRKEREKVEKEDGMSNLEWRFCGLATWEMIRRLGVRR